jgi:hypothetical protein
MLDYGVFYEFVPVDDLGLSHPRRHTVADVELDRPYAVVLTQAVSVRTRPTMTTAWRTVTRMAASCGRGYPRAIRSLPPSPAGSHRGERCPSEVADGSRSGDVSVATLDGQAASRVVTDPHPTTGLT